MPLFKIFYLYKNFKLTVCNSTPIRTHIKCFSKPHPYNTSETEFMGMALSVLYGYDDNGTDFHEDFRDFAATTNNAHEQAQFPIEIGLNALCINNTLDVDTYEQLEHISFWIEGISQCVIGVFGIISNLLMIPILSSASMKSIFNRLLACLLMIHTIYISTTLIIYIGLTEWIEGSKHWFNVLFPFVLHPLRPLMLYSSSFITILMARQRYMAVRHPVEYRNSNVGINPWKPAIRSLVLVLVSSTVFVFPLWFETTIRDVQVPQVKDINGTHFQYVSKCKQTYIYIYIYIYCDRV